MGVVLSIGAALLIYPGGCLQKTPGGGSAGGGQGLRRSLSRGSLPGGYIRGRDPVRDGDPGAADATEEVRDGEVVALAIRQEDGMGQRPQGESTVLDLRTADRLLAGTVKR